MAVFHTDYDSRRLEVARTVALASRPYIPKGCDQQGRYLEALRDVAPAPAEAATDIGAEPHPRMPRVRPAWDVGHTLLLLYVCALIAFVGGCGFLLLKVVLVALGAR